MTDASEDHEGTVSTGGRTITNLCFADDIDGLAGEEEELANLVERLNKASTAYGKETSVEKTKLMTNNTIGINTEIKVNGQKLETVTSFKYLGSVMIDEGSKPVLLQILNDILTAVDDDKISILLLLDLSAAFDTIDHEILLSCLEHDFGIRSTALNWFQSHLSDRKQYDLVDSQK